MKNVIRNGLRFIGLERPAQELWWRLSGSATNTAKVYRSETSKCRARLAPFCLGYGLDLGFGGDPITASAIRMDMPLPYAYTGNNPVQLGGRAEDLFWFRDSVLDFIYSSHLLEDYVDTQGVLTEWLRVLKPGGRIIIFCPDEQVYRQHCRATGQTYNTHHIHTNFSLSFVTNILSGIGQTTVIHENPLVDIYSWELVVEKINIKCHLN
jgi:SAM-dependent methyltransferase